MHWGFGTYAEILQYGMKYKYIRDAYNFDSIVPNFTSLKSSQEVEASEANGYGPSTGS